MANALQLPSLLPLPPFFPTVNILTLGKPQTNWASKEDRWTIASDVTTHTRLGSKQEPSSFAPIFLRLLELERSALRFIAEKGVGMVWTESIRTPPTPQDDPKIDSYAAATLMAWPSFVATGRAAPRIGGNLQECIRFFEARTRRHAQALPVSETFKLLLIANALPSAPTHKLNLYETPDSGIVVDAAAKGTRIVCVLRDNYAHVMSGPPDNMIDRIFEGAQYDLSSVLGFLKTLPTSSRVA